MAALKRSTHQLHVTNALEGKVDATIGHVDDDFLDRTIEIFRVHAIGCTQLLGDLEFGRVDVDGDDAGSLGFYGADNSRQTDAAKAENGHGITRLHLGGVEHCTDTGSDTAAQQADFFQWCFLGDFRNGNLRKHGVLGERGSAHIVENRFALVGKTRSTVGHQAFALGRANRLAEVGFSRQAEFALTALRGVQRDHMITNCNRGHALTDCFHDRTTFMAEDRREDAFRISAGQCVGIGMANTGGHHAQQDFAGLGHGDIDFNDFEGLFGLEGNGGARLDHGDSPVN